jgi:hypothetical protein
MNYIGTLKKMILIQLFLLVTAASVPAMSIFAHYMPWFKTQGRSGAWTHWGDTIPNHLSHFTPLIGLYDSKDPDVLEYQVLTMKFAGIDGVFVDWYGINNGLPEYGAQPIFQVCTKAGMKYGIVWEDRYVNAQGGATPVLQFMENNFFKTSNYIKINNRPLLLIWQITYLTGAQWQTNMNSTSFQNKPILITRDVALTPAAEGAYSWINAAGGTAQAIPGLNAFISSNNGTYMIPTALPRFVDDYPTSYGTIDDQAGQMFVGTLTRCLKSGYDVVQIGTWNDWQEGTIIEPSTQYQYRDLEAIQTLRKQNIDPQFSYTPAHLRIPDRLFRERRQYRGNAKEIARLDSAATALFAGNPTLGLNILDKKASGINRTAIKANKIRIGSGSIVYNVQGRKLCTVDFSQLKAKAFKNELKNGAYIIKNNDGISRAK